VHTIINGENYHALEMLQYTHAGTIDLIYVDPPYNTGNKTWKYNDRYVAEKDSYRHSKWLSFMEKRLLLAKKLLAPAGVIFVSIDDNEQHRLRMLMDQIFGTPNFIANVIWKNKTGGGNDARQVVTEHEYCLVYAKDRAQTPAFSVDGSGDPKYKFADEHEDTRGRYTIEALYRSSLQFSASLVYPIEAPDGSTIMPNDSNPASAKHIWRWSRTTFARKVTEGRVVFKLTKNGWRVFSKQYELEDDDGDPRTTQPRSVYSAVGSRRGTEGVKGIFGGDKRFAYPKPVEYVQWLIGSASAEDAVILDFFAGSGTTAEAIMRLNAEDGGTRQAILVTNNELSAADDKTLRAQGHKPGDPEYEQLGVFHSVTKQRIKTVITGTRTDGSKYSDGLAANAAFFDLQYLDRARVKYGHEFDSLAGVFWLRAGGRGPLIHRENLAKGFAYDPESTIAVLFRPGRASQLAEVIAAAPNPNLTHVFVVTESDEQGNVAASYFRSDLTVERIYGSYLSAFQVNKKD
jgi:adenine-specific DNA-methyltransferase